MSCRLITAPLTGEAVGAEDGLATARAERYLGLSAAVAARCREHLARWTVVSTARTAGVTPAGTATRITAAAAFAACGLSGSAAGRAPTGLGEAAVCVELLLGRSESELLAAVRAAQRFVVEIVEHQKHSISCGLSEPLSRREPLRGVIVSAAFLLHAPSLRRAPKCSRSQVRCRTYVHLRLGRACAAAKDRCQRGLPSRRTPIDFSIRRWRVSSVFAPLTCAR